MNSKKVSLFGKMAVSSVLALSTAAGVVVAPQMGAVANAATATYAEREVNVEFGNGSNMLYTMNIKIVTTLVDENGNESPTGTRVKATYVYHLTKAPNEKPYLTAIQLVPVNFNGMSQEEFKQALTIVRGQVYNGEENNINAMSPIGPEYKNYQQVLNSVVTGQYTQSSDATKLPIGFTAIKNSTNEGDFWVVNVIADADKFNENSYVDLHVKGLSPWNDQAYSGLNIQLKGANEANTGIYQASNNEAGLKVNQSMASAAGGNNLNLATDVIKAAKENEAAQAAAKAALEDAQANASKVIDKLPNLTDAEKQAAKDAAKAAGDIAGVIAAVAAAAKKDIDENQNLTDAEKAAAKADVDAAVAALPTNAAPSEAALTTVVQPAIDANSADEQKLADAKAAAKKDIDELKNLSDNQKDAYKKQVDAQTTVDGVIDVVAAAAKADIDANSNLNDTEKDDAKKAVDEAADNAKEGNGDVTDVTKPADNAGTSTGTNTDADSLAAFKDAAKAKIDALGHLTDAQKDAYKALIDSANTIPAIIDIVAVATKADIDANSTLTSDEKQAAKDEVDQAAADAKQNAANGNTGTGSLDNVVAPADKTGSISGDTAELDKLKADAVAAIEGMEYLRPGQKEAYIDGVNSARTTATIISIVREAARTNVDQNPTLTADEKAAAKAQIDGAATIGDLEAYAGTQHGYSDGEVTNNNTTTIVNHTNGSSSSKVPWWVYLLTILGIGGGVASWGYVHDADFRAVVDGAIANFQRAVDNALGIRR
ncbi:MAG: GA module-containing protein [Corynebacterium sp.]|nr:GA module-containing protein [Corynebacterium sp.]